MAILSEQESKSRDLLDRSRQADNYDGGFPTRQVIRQVFRAMWVNSLTADRIKVIGEAMSGCEVIPEDFLKKQLSRLVREGTLRSRVHQGVRLYEINF